jgi:hypothetical protein
MIVTADIYSGQLSPMVSPAVILMIQMSAVSTATGAEAAGLASVPGPSVPRTARAIDLLAFNSRLSLISKRCSCGRCFE